jgi:serine/threonine protein kinase
MRWMFHFHVRTAASKLKFDAASYPPGTEIDCPNCTSSISIPRPNIGPGVTIGGFELKKLLGKGGMGEVYLATQLSMHREVALKILPGHFAMQDGNVDRFLQEVKMAARLKHSNIVRAYEAGEDHGVYFLAMDFVEGTAIVGRLRKDGAMPEPEVRIIAEKLGRALDQIWEKHKMIHRDIKPANIMLDEYGEPLLMDMGLSKALDDGPGMTVSTAIMGSPNYMSPEQAEGAEGLDFRTDMYSLGATFYHMLTGKVPFKGKSVMEVLRKQATEQLPDPRDHKPDISEGMVRIIERMMAKKPEGRYVSWSDFLKDLESLVLGTGPVAPELGPGESVIMRASELSSAAVEENDADPIASAGEPDEGWDVDEDDGWSDVESDRPRLAKILGIAVVVGALIGSGVYLGTRPGGGESPPANEESIPEPDTKSTRTPSPAPVKPAVVVAAEKVDLDRGLIGRWSFEEGEGLSVADLSENGLTGTLQGPDTDSMWVSDSAPAANTGRTALKLTTQKNILHIPTDTTLGLRTNITMCGWVKLHSGKGGLIRDLITRSSNNGLRVTMGGLAVIANDEGFSQTGITHQRKFEPEKWIHVLATYNGRAIRTFVNAGAPIVKRAPGLIRKNTTGAIQLGRQGGSPVEAHFTIDDVRIYDRVLNDSEIMVLAGQLIDR